MHQSGKTNHLSPDLCSFSGECLQCYDCYWTKFSSSNSIYDLANILGDKKCQKDGAEFSAVSLIFWKVGMKRNVMSFFLRIPLGQRASFCGSPLYDV